MSTWRYLKHKKLLFVNQVFLSSLIYHANFPGASKLGEFKHEHEFRKKRKLSIKTTYIAKILGKEDQAVSVPQNTKKLHYVRVAQLLPQSKFLQKDSPAVSKVSSTWLNPENEDTGINLRI